MAFAAWLAGEETNKRDGKAIGGERETGKESLCSPGSKSEYSQELRDIYDFPSACLDASLSPKLHHPFKQNPFLNS